MSRFTSAALPALLMRGGMLVVGVLAVRRVAPFLGSADLGSYAVLQSISAWTALAALGLPEACSGMLAKFHHQGRLVSGRRYLDTSFSLILFTASVCILLILLAAGSAIAVGAYDFPQLMPLVVTTVTSFLAVPFGLAQAPLNADGQIARSTAWSFGIAVLGLLAIWIVTSTTVPASDRLLVLSATVGTTNLAARWAMHRVETRRRYGAASGRAKLSRRRTTALFASSYPFVVISLAALAAFQVDRLVAYHFLSPQETARLDVTLKVFLAVYGVYAVLVARLWKLIGHAWNAGRPEVARQVLLRSFFAALAAWSVVGAILVLCIEPIVTVFTHGTIVWVDPVFVIALAAFMATRASIDTVSISIYAIRKQHQTLATVIAHGLLNIVLSIAGCLAFGLTGIVCGQLAALLLTSGWRFPLIFWRATAPGRR